MPYSMLGEISLMFYIYFYLYHNYYFSKIIMGLFAPPHNFFSGKKRRGAQQVNLRLLKQPWIGSGGFGGHARRAPPLRPKIFSISCSFFCKIWQNHMLAPPLESWRPLLRGILDPPLIGLLIYELQFIFSRQMKSQIVVVLSWLSFFIDP